MVISERHRYIFIAVPRTASNSVAAYLLANDPSAESNVVHAAGRTIPVQHHVSAMELKAILGERYNRYYTFGFVRAPSARFLSLYSYYRHGDAATITKALRFRWTDHGGRRVLLARLLPFGLWSFVYPYRSCASFLTDERGELVVDRVGRFESLEEDVGQIARRIGLNVDVEVPRLNAAQHQDAYPNQRWLDRWLAFKFRRDRRFYAAGQADSWG